MPRFTHCLAALMVVIFTASLATAQPDASDKATENAVKIAQAGKPSFTVYASIGMGLSVVGIGIGLGLIGYGALSGMARQPEMVGTLSTNMLIVGGLVEGAGILSLILCLVTVFV